MREGTRLSVEGSSEHAREERVLDDTNTSLDYAQRFRDVQYLIEHVGVWLAAGRRAPAGGVGGGATAAAVPAGPDAAELR